MILLFCNVRGIQGDKMYKNVNFLIFEIPQSGQGQPANLSSNKAAVCGRKVSD